MHATYGGRSPNYKSQIRIVYNPSNLSQMEGHLVEPDNSGTQQASTLMTTRQAFQRYLYLVLEHIFHAGQSWADGAVKIWLTITASGAYSFEQTAMHLEDLRLLASRRVCCPESLDTKTVHILCHQGEFRSWGNFFETFWLRHCGES
jgi:hypothetical protein